ncbi:hypothetical protein HYW46_03730 [Candidatus Daviesbacteria bacterium]|nr:hypothetical protein [Candidatus Daviesbacteria bacterium]
MGKQKGVIHLALPLLLLLVIAGSLLIYFGFINNPFKNLPGLSKKQSPKVTLKTGYRNPFNKDTQYLNPFQAYKNPFLNK